MERHRYESLTCGLFESSTILQAAESQVHMANLSSELKLKSREECQDLLHEVMPLIVGNGSLELRAQLHWTIAMVLLRRRTRRDLLSASPRYCQPSIGTRFHAFLSQPCIVFQPILFSNAWQICWYDICLMAQSTCYISQASRFALLFDLKGSMRMEL